jgi:putative chitinase
MKLNQLTPQQLSNAKLVDQALVDIKLVNPYLRAGILAVVSKESSFLPKSENSYSTTPASRIREIFGVWFNGMTDQQINTLKKDDRAFFNHVYSNNKFLGNLGGDDGYNFRGRSMNQITGRANYTDLGKKLGVDLVNNPDLLLDPQIGAKACAKFFYDSIVRAQGSGQFQNRHHIVRTSEIITITQGALIAHDINGGFGIWPPNDPTGGFKITSADAPSYLTLTQAK